MEDQWVDLRVAQALRPEEVADPALLHRREKLRIAGELGVDVAKVRDAAAGRRRLLPGYGRRLAADNPLRRAVGIAGRSSRFASR